MTKNNDKTTEDRQQMMNPIQNGPNRFTRDELFNMLYCLISFNSPYGSEYIYHDFLPPGGTFDDSGNYHLRIGEEGESETMFCCHMDTVGSSIVATKPVIEEERYFGVGNSKAHCLGGDDKCGFLILNALARNKTKGTYIYHVGEERGCIGSKALAQSKTFDFSKYKRAIQFDRKATTSVITKMMGSTKVCSKEFADALCEQIGLGFKKDEGGSYTDVASYNELIPEVTNLSCGYTREHGTSEKIDILWLLDDMIPALYNVDWENLPTVRDPKDKAANVEERWKNTGGSSYNFSSKDFDINEREIFELIAGMNRVNARGSSYRRKHNREYVNKILRRYYAEGAIDIEYDRYREEYPQNDNNNTKPDDVPTVDESAFAIYATEADCYRCEHCLSHSQNFENVTILGKSVLLCESCVQLVEFENGNT